MAEPQDRAQSKKLLTYQHPTLGLSVHEGILLDGAIHDANIAHEQQELLKKLCSYLRSISPGAEMHPQHRLEAYADKNRLLDAAAPYLEA